MRYCNCMTRYQVISAWLDNRTSHTQFIIHQKVEIMRTFQWYGSSVGMDLSKRESSSAYEINNTADTAFSSLLMNAIESSWVKTLGPNKLTIARTPANWTFATNNKIVSKHLFTRLSENKIKQKTHSKAMESVAYYETLGHGKFQAPGYRQDYNNW